jgi:hypothetical protein
MEVSYHRGQTPPQRRRAAVSLCWDQLFSLDGRCFYAETFKVARGFSASPDLSKISAILSRIEPPRLSRSNDGSRSN